MAVYCFSAMSGVVLHKVLRLLCWDHIDVTHLTNTHTDNKPGDLIYAASIWQDFHLKLIFYAQDSFAFANYFTHQGGNDACYLVPEFDAIELIGWLQKLRSEGCGDELSMSSQLHNHVWKTAIQSIDTLQNHF